MKILRIIEEDDKCSRMECEFTHDEVEILMSYAVTNILKEQIKKQDSFCEDSNSKILCHDCGEVIDDETLKEEPDTVICGECIRSFRYERGC